MHHPHNCSAVISKPLRPIYETKVHWRSFIVPDQELTLVPAFGDAAGACLEHFHIIDNNHENKLGVLAAYYPNVIPDPRAAFPSTMEVVVHLAGDEVGEVRHSQLAGVEGKRKVVRHDLKDAPGKGKKLDFAYPCYKYDAEPGFAERDLDVYDGESAAMAQDRTLTAVKKAFSV
jgi:hypothetical protein